MEQITMLACAFIKVRLFGDLWLREKFLINNLRIVIKSNKFTNFNYE